MSTRQLKITWKFIDLQTELTLLFIGHWWSTPDGLTKKNRWWWRYNRRHWRRHQWNWRWTDWCGRNCRSRSWLFLCSWSTRLARFLWYCWNCSGIGSGCLRLGLGPWSWFGLHWVGRNNSGAYRLTSSCRWQLRYHIGNRCRLRRLRSFLLSFGLRGTFGTQLGHFVLKCSQLRDKCTASILLTFTASFLKNAISVN